MTNAIPSSPGFLTAMGMANHLGVSIETLRHWKNWEGWPRDSRTRDGQYVMYEVRKVEEWLRSRPVGKRGPKPRWLSVVGHAAA